MCVAVLIPVLGRPHRVAPLVQSLRDSETVTRLTPIFISSPGDNDERDAIRDVGCTNLGVGWEPGSGDYARKINVGAKYVAGAGPPFYLADWVFMGADDLRFEPGWAEQALAAAKASQAAVVGTNDLGNMSTVNGDASTHSLVATDYLTVGTIDEQGKLLHEGYDHQFIDDELVGTAKFRGVYVHAADCVVEHLHPNWGKSPTDPTYEKAVREFTHDRDLYLQRRPLWGGL